MPIVLVGTFLILLFTVGFEKTIPIMVTVGTGWALIAAFLKWASRPRRDSLGRFHSRNSGRYISNKAGFLGYMTACSALILPGVTKTDLFVNTLPILSSLSLEMQAIYALAVHIIGFWLSQ